VTLVDQRGAGSRWPVRLRAPWLVDVRSAGGCAFRGAFWREALCSVGSGGVVRCS